MYKYNTIASDTLVGFFLEVLCLLLAIRPERKMLLVLEMPVTRKIFTWAAANLLLLINLIDSFEVYTERTTLTALFFVEKQRVLPFIVQREKTSIRLYMFASRKPL